MQEAPLNHVLDDCSVEQWSDRVAAVNVLARMCRGGGRRAELLARIDSVVRVLLDRVGDAHYKVTQAALQALTCFVEVMRTAVEPHLQWVLPEALSQLTAVKRAVRDAASELVDMVRRCYLGSQLAPLAIRVLDTPSTAARVGALDLLVHLLSQPDVVAHFYNAARMRTVRVCVAESLARCPRLVPAVVLPSKRHPPTVSRPPPTHSSCTSWLAY